MAFYSDEEEVWKCLRHPSSNRGHGGICPVCLCDRLTSLCPNCAKVRPCSCSCFPAAAAAFSSSTSSSTSSPFYDLLPSSSGLGIIGRISNLIDSEPPFTRTRSTGIHFLTSRFGAVDPFSSHYPNKSSRLPPPENRRIISRIWSVFRTPKNKEGDHDELAREEETNQNYYSRPETIMRRSTSTSTSASASASLYNISRTRATATATASKSATVVKSTKGWHFPSPMKVFRHHKTSKVVQEH